MLYSGQFLYFLTINWYVFLFNWLSSSDRFQQGTTEQGWIQDFYLEGAHKVMRERAHHERETRVLYDWALEALGGFDALLRYLSLTFKHSDINGI